MGDAGLVGRTVELAALRPALLAPACRLLTLTGPPGVGKTRLAGALADELGDRFVDGVVTVDLLDCDSVDGALSLVQRQLGTGGRSTAGEPVLDRLARTLADRSVLLVLDSCEAVPDLPPALTTLLAAARGAKVLATSQQRLHLTTERVYAVPPLAMPSPDAGLDDLAEVPAMAMLLAGTAVVRPELTLGEDNRAALVALCRQLEGLPLALEVAAARLAQFEPAEVAVRLRNRAQLLDSRLATAGRHRSLRTAISWSHDLLGEEERWVFRHVALFPSTWSLADADAVAGRPGLDVGAAVASLVGKSLVRRVGGRDDVEELDLLDSLRSFGREQLVACGDDAAARERHRRYYAGLATSVEAAMGTPDEVLATAWTAGEVASLRLALDNARAVADLTAALPLAAALGWFCYTRGQLVAASPAADLVRDVLRDGPAPGHQEALGGAVLVAGVLAWARGDVESAATLLPLARDLAERHGVVRRSAIAHAFLGHLARSRGHTRTAWQEHTIARTSYASLTNDHGVAWSDHDLGLVALDRGQPDRAEGLLTQALAEFEREQDPWCCAWAWSGLAAVAVARGDWTRAQTLVDLALPVYRANGDTARVDHCRDLQSRITRGQRPVEVLTGRQREVAALVAGGATNRHIARELGISDKTVEMHLGQIMARLGVHNRAQVAAHAVQTGLTTP